ncbi:MAG: threonine-phosphate decarboxylase CobD [Pseudomonadota bacterium]
MSRDLVHGGALDAMREAFPHAPEPWIDLSTGINPWPYPSTVVTPEDLARLPTRSAFDACREAMAAAIGAPAQSLVLAPGSELIIRLLPDVIRPRRIAILTPTYGDHAAAWERAGAEILKTEDPLPLAPSVDAIVLTHPNNPDGRLFDRCALETARRALKARGGWLIVDEAFADLAPERSLAPQGGADGLIVLRSFGKFFGLAGLRLGALIAPAPVRDAMADRLGAWPVSGTALAVGTRAYADTAWQIRTRTALGDAAARLNAILKAGGMRPVGGTSLFRFVETDDAYTAFNRLAGAGIYGRRFAWSQTHLRVGLPADAEAEARLRAALSG